MYYEFVFEASEAISDAGGVLTAGVVAFTATVTCILCLTKGENGCKKEGGWKSKLCCCCALFTQALLLAFIFGVLIVAPKIEILDSKLERLKYLELWTFSGLIIPAVCVSWCKFKKALKTCGWIDVAANLPPQSYRINLPSGPPADGNEQIGLVTIETQGNYIRFH